jgi:PAS domain S-box-containing protein/putative nucleotidyltransferase with HDIG domain
MSKKLRVLIVEDSEDDAELVLRELRSGGYEPLSERIDTHTAMADALKKKTWDVIITDYSMPHFNGLQALKLLRSSALDIPCIIVSGKIGEDTAVQLMKAGANDYVMKGNLKRLASAIERELGDAKVRRERKRAEEELRQSEEKHRTLVENLPQKIFLKDENSVYISCNENYAEDLKIKAEEIAGKTDYDFYPKGLAEQYRQDDKRIIETCRIEEFEEKYVQDGRESWVHTTKAPVKDEKGNVIGLIGIFWDITERKWAEKKLQESEKKHRAVVEMASDVIIIIQDGIIRFANPRVTNMLGYETGEIEGMEYVSFIPPENLGPTLERYQKRMAGEKLPEIYATELLHKSGRKISVETSGNVIEYAGKPADLVTIRDITERKQAEEAIKESEERYRTLFESSAEGILFADLETQQFQYANPAICRMLGYTEEELRTMDVTAIHPKENLPSVLAEFEAQARGDKILAPELPCLRKDGTILYADVNAFSITIGGRRFNAGFFRDVTERRLSQEKLEKSYESVKKTLNDAINTMVKIVEMRDPYTSGHQQKVADLATAIAREMKLEDTQIDQLRTAAIIHDIGKMYVPSDLLNKPGKLADMELGLIKTHAQSGYDVVKGMDFPGNIAKAVLQHHERLDGSGYPNNLKGEDTLLEAKILAVADVVEAMASHRPYRPALGIDKALEEISKNRGRLYDPDVADACLKLFNSGKFKFKSV